MKRLMLFLVGILFSCASYAQYPRPLRNLWTRAQVHVIFGDYSVSFSIRDIDKALALLRESGVNSYPATCGLDTGKNYFYELQEGAHSEYESPIQPLIQNVVGPYLLSEGWAIVANSKYKVLPEITVDVGFAALGGETMFVNFYDPKTKKMLFAGRMPGVLYKRDLGIDN